MGVITDEEFTKIVNEKRDILLKLAGGILKNNADAEDIISEVFLTAWEKRDQVRDASKFYYWIYKITINKSITMLNKRNRETLVADVPDDKYYMEDNYDISDTWECVEKLKER